MAQSWRSLWGNLRDKLTGRESSSEKAALMPASQASSPSTSLDEKRSRREGSQIAQKLYEAEQGRLNKRLQDTTSQWTPGEPNKLSVASYEVPQSVAEIYQKKGGYLLPQGDIRWEKQEAGQAAIEGELIGIRGRTAIIKPDAQTPSPGKTVYQLVDMRRLGKGVENTVKEGFREHSGGRVKFLASGVDGNRTLYPTAEYAAPTRAAQGQAPQTYGSRRQFAEKNSKQLLSRSNAVRVTGTGRPQSPGR